MTLALSSTEAEYRGAAFATCKVVWLKRILKDLGVPIKDLILLYCDNMSNIYLARNTVLNVNTITSSESAFRLEMSSYNI